MYRYAPVYAVLFRRVVGRRDMIRTAIVPDDNVALAPLVPVLSAWLNHVVGQFFDHIFAFCLPQAFDVEDFAGIKIESFASSLRVRA